MVAPAAMVQTSQKTNFADASWREGMVGQVVAQTAQKEHHPQDEALKPMAAKVVWRALARLRHQFQRLAARMRPRRHGRRRAPAAAHRRRAASPRATILRAPRRCQRSHSLGQSSGRSMRRRKGASARWFLRVRSELSNSSSLEAQATHTDPDAIGSADGPTCA